MGKLILLIAFLAVALILIQQIKQTPPAQRKGLYLKYGLTTLAVMLVIMAATGRIHWLGALFGALIPFVRSLTPWLIRLFPLLAQYQRHRAQQAPPQSSGNSSEVRTSILHMILDHDANQLTGSVIAGPYQGRSLDQLNPEQIQKLWEHCQLHDADSLQLLERYLALRHGAEWRQKFQQQSGNGFGEMDRTEALAILGLEAGASREQIIQAHRKLMQKLHPDRGGNDFLAAKINAAKDLLLS